MSTLDPPIGRSGTPELLQDMRWQDEALSKPALELRGDAVEYADARMTDALRCAGKTRRRAHHLGPNGASDEAAYLRLVDGLHLIKRWLRAERPLLRVCLGARLMARALGTECGTVSRPEVAMGPPTFTVRRVGTVASVVSIAANLAHRWIVDAERSSSGGQLATAGVAERAPTTFMPLTLPPAAPAPSASTCAAARLPPA